MNQYILMLMVMYPLVKSAVDRLWNFQQKNILFTSGLVYIHIPIFANDSWVYPYKLTMYICIYIYMCMGLIWVYV